MYERGVAIGLFWVFKGNLKLITGSFMGFGVGLVSVGPPQGDSWVFEYLWGFFRGLRGQFMHINAIFMIEHVFNIVMYCDINNYF